MPRAITLILVFFLLSDGIISTCKSQLMGIIMTSSPVFIHSFYQQKYAIYSDFCEHAFFQMLYLIKNLIQVNYWALLHVCFSVLNL